MDYCVGDKVLVCTIPENSIRYATITHVFGMHLGSMTYDVEAIDGGDTAIATNRDIGKQACLAQLQQLIKQVEAMEDG